MCALNLGSARQHEEIVIAKAKSLQNFWDCAGFSSEDALRPQTLQSSRSLIGDTMKFPSTFLSATLALSATTLIAQEIHGVHTAKMDTPAVPGDIWYRHANGTFRSHTEIPADRTSISLHGKPAPVVDGLTGEQQFFIGYAQSEVDQAREASLRNEVATDRHSPSEYRADTVRNLDPWRAAFDVKPSTLLPTNAFTFGRASLFVIPPSKVERGICFCLCFSVRSTH
jgi:hypothetical protein